MPPKRRPHTLSDANRAVARLPWTLVDSTTTPLDLLHRFAPGPDVLEVGCGVGLEAYEIAQAGFNVQAIDGDAPAIAVAQARPPPVRGFLQVEKADFLRTVYVDQFDVVYERGVIHNLKSHRARVDLARRIARSLRQGGVWISVCGSADDARFDRAHGCLYLSHVVTAAERYFEALFSERRPYGQIGAGFSFDAWYSVFRRR
jgi:SAM-dependent methyltransferase